MYKPRTVRFILPKRCAVCNKKIVVQPGQRSQNYARRVACGPRCAAISRSRNKTTFGRIKYCVVCRKRINPPAELLGVKLERRAHKYREQFKKRATCSRACQNKLAGMRSGQTRKMKFDIAVFAEKNGYVLGVRHA